MKSVFRMLEPQKVCLWKEGKHLLEVCKYHCGALIACFPKIHYYSHMKVLIKFRYLLQTRKTENLPSVVNWLQEIKKQIMGVPPVT